MPCARFERHERGYGFAAAGMKKRTDKTPTATAPHGLRYIPQFWVVCARSLPRGEEIRFTSRCTRRRAGGSLGQWRGLRS